MNTMPPKLQIHELRESLIKTPSWVLIFSNPNLLTNWIIAVIFFGFVGNILLDIINNGIVCGPLPGLDVFLSYLNPYSLSLLLCASLNSTDWIVPSLLCFYIEKAISMNVVPYEQLLIMHSLNLLTLPIIPLLIILKCHAFSIPAMFVIVQCHLILVLKLWSYIQVNLWNRNLDYDENSSCRYPDNLTLRNFFYFLVVPTLCYDLNYPKTDKIRVKFIARLLIEMIIALYVILHIFKRFISPQLVRLTEANISNFQTLEIYYQMVISVHLTWISIFYAIFQCWLNILSEITYFGDRNFYDDWWNATTTSIFWRKWNSPVHKWAIRHLYGPLIDMGFQSIRARNITFFMSGVFHELNTCLPLRSNGVMWGFIGMMVQIPFNDFTKRLVNSWGPKYGNLAIWITNAAGQTFFLIMYYKEYFLNQNKTF